LAKLSDTSGFVIAPIPDAPRLTRAVTGTDQYGKPVDLRVVEERPLTIYLNSQEIVTAMTIGDYPEYLALGFLKKTRTSGCAVGTVFGDMMEGLEGLVLPDTNVRTSDLYALAAIINRTPSLYLEAGAIHGSTLCQGARPLVYMEDVGRHNAVDKIAGWMLSEGVDAADKVMYTTGRLTSEMVIKCALMGIPVLASRSGFTAWGVEIAQQVGLTLIGRMKGQRFVCLAGEHRLIRDADPAQVADEPRKSGRKGA